MARENETDTHLSDLERVLLILPMLGGAFFGLAGLVLDGAFGRLVGYSGDDPFVYRLAGAAALGYAPGLFLGIRERNWLPLRLVMLAILVFNLASLYACFVEITSGSARPVVYLILIASLAITAISGSMLYRRREAPRPARDLPQWIVWATLVGALLSTFFGLLPLLLPNEAARLFSLRGTDIFVYRLAGAASLGYGIMALFAARAQDWLELRLPWVLALFFNGLSFIASALAILEGQLLFIVFLIGAASLAATFVAFAIIQRGGK